MPRWLNRVACVLAAWAILLVSAGCTSVQPAQGADARRITALENQLDGLRTLFVQPNIAVEPEPERSVTTGDYVGWIKDVSSGSTSVVTEVDFLTDRHGHGNATNTLNKWHVVQQLPVREDALIAVYAPDYGPLTVVTAVEFAARWQTQKELAGTAYFVFISDGEVFAMWPTNYPRSLPEVKLN